MQRKIFTVAPHLSTGGQPQYLLAKLKRLRSHYKLVVAEYSYCGDAYVVQRNQIINLVGRSNFFGRFPVKDLPDIINKEQPDVVHFEEFPELFCDPEISARIYSQDRPYSITETTHSSTFNVKTFLPDRFLLVSEWSKRQYASLGIPSEVIRYTPDVNKVERSLARETLNIPSDAKVVLNVGLFTPGKNQGEAFDIAARMPDVSFYFVGNRAPNFEHYWGKLYAPPNCFILGEHSDVATFYSAADVFLFPSKFELNPLVIIEAIAYGLPVVMRDLDTYCGAYVESDRLKFLTPDVTVNCKLIRSFLQ